MQLWTILAERLNGPKHCDGAFPLTQMCSPHGRKNPQFATIWYDAAGYCNWLSERDGIPHEQWVYPDKNRAWHGDAC